MLDQSTMKHLIGKIAHEILGTHHILSDLRLIGIQTEGTRVLEALVEEINRIAGMHVPYGVLNPEFYRDEISPQMTMASTDIPFDISDKFLVCCDDVVDTGRTMRATIDALLDYGKPKRIQWAALAKLGQQELPMGPDYLGLELQNASDDLQTNSEYIGMTAFGDSIRLLSLSQDSEHGLLGAQGNFYNLFLTHANEMQLFKETITELEELISAKDIREHDLQAFFERNPEFIASDDYLLAHPRVVLHHETGQILKPDFVLEPIQPGGLSDLLELKLPTAQTFVLKKNRMRFSAAVLEACAQLREYSAFFEDERHREMIWENYRLKLYRPRMIVIIGRRNNIDPLVQKRIQSDLSGLNLKTYDDILERAKHKLKLR